MKHEEIDKEMENMKDRLKDIERLVEKQYV